MFGSSQTDDWLPKYGHLKFWGGVARVWCSNTKFRLGLHAVVYVLMNKFILGLLGHSMKTLYTLSAN